MLYMVSKMNSIAEAVKQLQRGHVIAYATEAVFGLGCDPDDELAVQRLLRIKQRPVEKGVILIAADWSQLLPYVDITLVPDEKLDQAFASWETDKKSINRVKNVKEEIDSVKIEMAEAERNYDFERLSELKYSRLQALTKELAEEEVKLFMRELEKSIRAANAPDESA